MTFNDEQQKEHRDAFIKECRQKAWGAACHADWVSKSLDELMARYQGLQADDRALEAEIHAAEIAVDYHTVENRSKRKELQGRRNMLADQMKAIGQNVEIGRKAFTGLYQSVESALSLAAHAGEWKWAEVEPKSQEQ